MARDLDAERIVRPRLWAYGFVEDEANPERHRLLRDATFGLLRAYYYWHDVGEPLRAETYINQAYALAGGLIEMAHPALAPELVFHLARFKNNPMAARIQLETCPPATSVRHIERRAEASILFAEKRYVEAIDVARRASLLLSYSDPEVAILERDWLDQLIMESLAS